MSGSLGRLVLEPASKINLYLRVGPPGGDGFHPVVTVLAATSLRDRLELEIAPDLEPGRIRLEVTGAELGDPEANLAVRAARAFAAGFPDRLPESVLPGLSIRLEKRVPHQAGLGGGSADAAAVLLGLARLFPGAGPPGDETTLLGALAAGLGADVAFFLRGGYAFATGRGEKVQWISSPLRLGAVLVKPAFGMPTGPSYRDLDRIRGLAPGASAAPATLEPDARARALVAALGAEDPDPERVMFLAGNDFEAVEPEALAPLRRNLAEAGAETVLLCGSGSALAGLFPDHDAARRAAARMPVTAGGSGPYPVELGGPGVLG